MEWNKIKNTYPESWYELIDYIAEPGLYKERRIRITGGALAADACDENGEWIQIESLSLRDLYEFFEQNGIFVVILYNEWFGYFSYEIYSEMKNEISTRFESRKDAEEHAFNRAFALLEKEFARA